MNRLEQARKKIEKIDHEMAQLYEKRLDAVMEVLSYKKEHNLPVLDRKREKELIKKNSLYIQNSKYTKSYQKFFEMVMENSKEFQRKELSQRIVAYAGVKGSFSQIVCEKEFPYDQKLDVSSFEEVFQAVITQKAEFGIIPFENTQSGFVTEVLDLLMKYPLYIQKVIDQEIEQCLLGTKEATLKDIEWVYSKDQALMQSKSFLKKLGVQTVSYPNTAVAAQYVALQNDKRKAAIGAKENAELYNLQILSSPIQADYQNTTRFLIIGKECQRQRTRSSIMLTTNHKSGALAKVVEIIARYGFNMESIQSRPISKKPFQYYFFIEIDGQFEKAHDCLQEVQQVCESLKIVGTYFIEGKE